MFTRIATPAILSIALFAIGCGSGLEYRHDQHESGQFDRYRTLSFMQANDVGHFTRGELNPEQREAAQGAAREILDQKSWEIVDDASQADLVVIAGVGSRIRVEDRIEGQPTMRFDTYEQEINEGTIVLDAFDRRTREHVWHGQVIGAGDPPAPPERVAEAVRLLLSEFPAAGTGEPLPADSSGGEEPAVDDGADDGAAGDEADGAPAAPAPSEDEDVQG